ncbi:heterokaryon incompatibility protein-domain-containing protein [Halenospora varia]|nr:heterokaryon incompatibility protein-domain-containing protein [Halenospora varia]
MVLCSYCQNLSFSDLVLTEEQFTAKAQTGEHLGYRHQPSFPALQESAKSCELCHMFAEALKADDHQEQELRDFVDSRDREHPINLTSGTIVWGNEPPRMAQITIEWDRHCTSSLGLFADPDSAAATSQDVIGRRIEDVCDSEVNVQRTLAWLDSCLSSHSECAIGSFPSSLNSWTQPLPTRLIKITSHGDELKVRLHETLRGSQGQYVALSHCWGLQQIITTTTSTYEDRKTDIPLSALSKTFQQSVMMTFRLGFKYVWIDSLCIIQDSGTDWEKEAAMMDLVYQNAVLTIAASAASDGQKGCFFSRTKQGPSPVEIQYHNSNGDNIGGVYIQGRVPTLDEELSRAPLNTRAWTLQERLLPKRILHCCASQLYWECHTCCFSESGVEFPPAYGLPRILESPKKNVEIITDFQSLHWRWMRLLDVYSQRALTKDFDKLPALSGLASEFAKRTGDQYLAGLWRQFLPVGLMWEVSNTANARKIPERAPSWSWASIEGRLGISQTPLRNIKQLAEVIDASITPLGLDTYGRVTTGEIRLRTKVVDGLYCGAERSPRWVAKPDLATGFYRLHVREDQKEVVGYFAPDDTTSPPHPRQTAMLIGELAEEVGKSIVDKFAVLYVEAVPGSTHTYRRVGTGIILSSTRCFEHAESRILSLI